MFVFTSQPMLHSTFIVPGALVYYSEQAVAVVVPTSPQVFNVIDRAGVFNVVDRQGAFEVDSGNS
jgi:hypothetical protein